MLLAVNCRKNEVTGFVFYFDYRVLLSGKDILCCKLVLIQVEKKGVSRVNLDSLSGLYINELFFRQQFSNTKQSMYQMLLNQHYQQLKQDPQNANVSDDELAQRSSLAIRTQLMNLAVQDPNAFNYSDEVARELVSKETGNNNFTEVADYMNTLVQKLGVNKGLPANKQVAFSSKAINKELSNKRYRNFAGRYLMHEDDCTYASMFDRHPLFQMDNNGNYVRNEKGQLIPTPAYFLRFMVNDPANGLDNSYYANYSDNSRKYDANNMVPAIPRVLRIAKQGSAMINSQDYEQSGFRPGPEAQAAYDSVIAQANAWIQQQQQIRLAQQQAAQASQVASQASQGSRQGTSPDMSNQSPMAFLQQLRDRIPGRYDMAPMRIPADDEINKNAKVKELREMMNWVPVLDRPTAAGDFQIGQISRDDLSREQNIYVSPMSADSERDVNYRQQFREKMLNANWNHDNGKYFWRAPNVAANSPVSLDELMNALDPFFPTGNMKDLMRSTIEDTKDSKDASMVEEVRPAVYTTDGVPYERALNSFGGEPRTINERRKVRDAEIRSAGVKANSHGVQKQMLLSHNGHLFSPSDVSKIQIILQTAQDNGLDYTIASNANGQVYLKVNDNRGMRVTLLDIDNPSNIGATRDRSGNEYQVNWDNVMVGNSEGNRRPVFSYITRNGVINRQPEVHQNATNREDQRYGVSAIFMNNYDAKQKMLSNERSDLKEAYLNYGPNSQTMDPRAYQMIHEELTKDGSDISKNGVGLDDDRFADAVTRAVRRDAMLTYKSLPEDFQQFMAVAPMIEALGLDTSRMNAFQEIAKKYGYSSDDVVAYGEQRLNRSITPTKGKQSVEMANVYTPETGKFEKRSGIGLDPGQAATVDTENGVMMRDSMFNNHTRQASDYAMSHTRADQEMAMTYRDSRMGLLRALNTAEPSDDDLYMSKVLDDYTKLVSEVAQSHGMNMSDLNTRQRLATAYASVARTVKTSSIKNGKVYEDFSANVFQAIGDSDMSEKDKEATKDFAKRIYRFINNEVGTAPLVVYDGYEDDRTPENLQKLRNQAEEDAETAKNDRANGRVPKESAAKQRLDDLGWYEEYGYHDGDQRHCYLDSVQEFTESAKPSIQYGFDLINVAKQTSGQYQENFTAHDPVQSKVIQQRMVNFDPNSRIYYSQLSKPFDQNLYDAKDSFNDWVLSQFDDYMQSNGKRVDLAHLDDQYQEWLQNLKNRDVSHLGSYDGENGQLILSAGAHALVNEDGEVLQRLPQHAPVDWNKYFVDGQLVNPQSKVEEQGEMLDQVRDTLASSGIELDYVDVTSGRNLGTYHQWVDHYMRSNNVSMDDAMKVMDQKIANGQFSEDISIDKNGLVHWSGHQLLVKNRRDVSVAMEAMHKIHDPNSQVRYQGYFDLQGLTARGPQQAMDYFPVEGTLGQFFVPDRQNIVHTNYHTFSTLTDEERQAVQDDEVAGYKAVIQYPRMINQRGDLAPEDMKNFNERLMVSSVQQVLYREIRENLRMQTAQLPINDSQKEIINDSQPLPFVLYSMAHLEDAQNIFDGMTKDEKNQILDPLHIPGELGRVNVRSKDVLGNPKLDEQPFSRDVLARQMNNWYQFAMTQQNPPLTDQQKQMLQSVTTIDANGNTVFTDDFIDDAVDHMIVNVNEQTGEYVRSGKVDFNAADMRMRRDFTRPEDTTIVNKAYSSEIAATKLTRPDQFDAKDPEDYDMQETLNRALYQAHRRMRLPNAVGEATNTAAIVDDMQNIEDAVEEWMELHPGEKPFGTPDFEYEIKNRVHSRVQTLGGNNIGMLADDQSLGYIDMLSTGQGKVQGLVRVLADNAQIQPDGHVKPAMIPVPMTDDEMKAYQEGKNDFDVMHVTAPDPNDPSKMKNYTYKMSRYLDGNALTKDEIFKYLSKLPFDRGFIAVEQAVKADYIDKDATLALMNANIMNMEDGSIISKHFADTHPIIGADGQLRPIETGDKLSDTSGDKTTAAIVIDPDMSLEEAKKKGILDVVLFMRKTNVDIIKSPLSQISRKNMSQVQDMIDSHDEYNEAGPDGTVKIQVPKTVTEEFTDKNGHTYHVGDLQPVMRQGYPVHADASDEEKTASYVDADGNEQHFFENGNGDFVKPILTDGADHRKSIEELAKQDANWVKFQEEGGAAAFKNSGKKFVDIEGHEQKSWPEGPVFEHDVVRDENGKKHFVLRPALQYEMDPHVIDTNTTIGNVTAYVTNIHADNKVNNYGIDPDASTEGRKYSDLVANADAERDATKLTQYLTSVDSKAIPDFREYLKLAGYELSADGRVFTGVNDDAIRDTYVSLVNSQIYTKNPKDQPEATLDPRVTDGDSAAQALGMSVDDMQAAYNNVFKHIAAVHGPFQGLPRKFNSSQDWQKLVYAVQQDQKIQHNIQEWKDAQSHPGEIRDHYSIDDMVNNDPNQLDDEASIFNAISLANERISHPKDQPAQVWDTVSPLPPMKGEVDDGMRNINLKGGNHQLIGSVNVGNRLDYQDQVRNAMSLNANDPRHMNRFASAQDALQIFTRNKFVGNTGKMEDLQKKHNENTVQTSMMIKDGKLSDAQKAALSPLLQRIGIYDGYKGLLAVPDMNGVRKRLYNGKLAKDELQQMDAGSEFMQMINNSDGGELELPDNMTVNLSGNHHSHTISILPQSLRKSRRSQSNGQTTIDDYTRDYAQIGVGLKRYQVGVKAIELTMPAYDQSFFTSKKAFEDYTKERAKYLQVAKKEIWDHSGIQDAVDRIQDRMVNSVFGKDSSGIKNNFIRQHIMSNRIKTSSTAVQTNGFDVPIDTIEVSPDIIKSLGMHVDPKTGYAYSPVPGDPTNKSWDMVHVHRDPVWRSHGSLGFRVKVNPSIVGVRVSPVAVSLMDGDFDGDTIGLIAVADKGGQEDLHNMVNVLSNVYGQDIARNGKTKPELGSTDLNVSAELVDLAARTNFKMDMPRALEDRKIPADVLKKTGTTMQDWNFGRITDPKTGKVDLNSARKLYTVASKLYPEDEGLSSTLDDLNNAKSIDDLGDSMNAKKVLKTYYCLGLDVTNRICQDDKQRKGAENALKEPENGKIGWDDPKEIIGRFINNTDESIRNDDPYRLEGAGVNAYVSEDGKVNKAKESYAAFIKRGAKGKMSALDEMFSGDYLNNQSLYSPEIMSYADAMHSFRDRIKTFNPEAYDEKTNSFDLSKIEDSKAQAGAIKQFNDIQNNFFDDKHKNMFVENKKNITKQLGLLSTVMDATKEKSDLTGQPGGQQKKLVAALADMGPQGLQIANAIGYVMTQATLQVKHDPVLAHKLGDIEVNGMKSIYNGNYEQRPLMLGLVGNRVSHDKSGVLVPLGTNTFEAGVNQQILKSVVDHWSDNKDFLKQYNIDLKHNDLSFHMITPRKDPKDPASVDDSLLLNVADKLVNFDPVDDKGNHLLTHDKDGNLQLTGYKDKNSDLYRKNLKTLAEGFDLATRPMFASWDKDTGKNITENDVKDKDGKISEADKLKIDDKQNRTVALTGDRNISPHAMAVSIDQMLKKSLVNPPITITRLVDLMTVQASTKTGDGTKINYEYVDSLDNIAKQHGGTLMRSKMKGLTPMASLADSNTRAVLEHGGTGQSLFTEQATEVKYQTVDERQKSLNGHSKIQFQKVSKWFNNFANQFDAAVSQGSATEKQVQDRNLYRDVANRLAAIGRGTPDESATYGLQRSVSQLIRNKISEQNGTDLTQNQQVAMTVLHRLNNRLALDAQRQDQIPDDRGNKILLAQQRLLKRHGLPENLKKWKSVASQNLSKNQVTHIEKALERIKQNTIKSYDDKKHIFIDTVELKKGEKLNRHFMNTTFRPQELSKGTANVAAIKQAQLDFGKNENVQNTLVMNDFLLKAVKANNLVVGGLKKPDGKMSNVEKALIAKNNCQKVVALYHSGDKANQEAFRRISKSLNEIELPIGDHKLSNRFERQLQDMLDGFDVAQSNLEYDPTVRKQVKKSDASKATDDEMKAFKEAAAKCLVQYNLSSDTDKVSDVKTTDGTDLKKEAAAGAAEEARAEAKQEQSDQYAAYLAKEKAQKEALAKAAAAKRAQNKNKEKQTTGSKSHDDDKSWGE